MTKKEILKDLINQNNQLLNKYISSNDTKNIEKHTAIKDILNQNDAFNKIDSVVAINILVDILDSTNEAIKAYKVLVMSD